MSLPGEDPLLEDLNDLYAWLIAMRKTVPPDKWVDELVEQANIDTFRGVL